MSSIQEIDFRRASGHPGLARAPEARLSTSPLSALRASVSRIARAVLNRIAANDLRDLDDYLLDDIGLTRGDLESTLAATGAFEDPTPGLARAMRARAWRRFAKARG